MNDTLQTICNDFITNRDTIKKLFSMESMYILPICANMFCEKGVRAEEEGLQECKKLLKEYTGIFSNFRGTAQVVAVSKLALSTDPESMLNQVLDNYELLKKHFHGSEYLALTAFILAEMTKEPALEERIKRGKDIYLKMKKEHPFLTSSEDNVFAVLMAFSERTDDELIQDMEGCYTLLKKRFSDGNSVQSLSHVLALSEGTPQEKTEKMISLYDGILAAGRKYGKYYELSALGALSVMDVDFSQVISDMLDVDTFLSGQKGYGGLSIDKKTRMMHAAMLVSDEYSPRGNTDAAVTEGIVEQKNASLLEMGNINTALTAGTMAAIAAQQAAMCAIIASTTAATVSSTS